MAYEWVILTTYNSWEPILQVWVTVLFLHDLDVPPKHNRKHQHLGHTSKVGIWIYPPPEFRGNDGFLVGNPVMGLEGTNLRQKMSNIQATCWWKIVMSDESFHDRDGYTKIFQTNPCTCQTLRWFRILIMSLSFIDFYPKPSVWGILTYIYQNLPPEIPSRFVAVCVPL